MVRSYLADPGPGTITFHPGDTVYVYYTGTGYALTSDLSGMTAFPLPYTDPGIRIVDVASSLLIQESGSVLYGNATATGTATTPATYTIRVT